MEEDYTRQLTIKDLDMVLRPLRDDLWFPIAFDSPHSYRGYYEQLAFEPAPGKTAAELRQIAESARRVFTGYKGGEFLMDDDTLGNIAFEGECGDADELTFAKFQRMLEEAGDKP